MLPAAQGPPGGKGSRGQGARRQEGWVRQKEKRRRDRRQGDGTRGAGAVEGAAVAGPGREGEGVALTADGVEGGLGPPLEALAQLQRVLLLVQQRVCRAVHGPGPVPSRSGRSLPLLRALPPGALPGAECSRETAPGLAAAAGTAGRGEARRGGGAGPNGGLLSPRRGHGSL